MKYEPNGMRVVDRLLREHGMIASDEIWVHGMWTVDKWLRCGKALLGGKKLVRMTHGSLSPVYLEHRGKWKKRLVAPLERWLLRRSERIVATCPAEAEWIRAWLHLTDSRRTSSSGRPLRRGAEPRIEIIDLRRFFNLDAVSPVDAASSPRPEDSAIHTVDAASSPRPVTAPPPPVDAASSPRPVDSQRSASSDLHILYLGRRHPLKGVEFLERAVEELNHQSPTPACDSNTSSTLNSNTSSTLNANSFTLRIVSDHAGETLECDWAWCDVLCLPTLSDNFGLVVAEALAHGKRVITTDGAPAWDPSVTGTDYGGRLVYLKGYRDGMPEARVGLLRDALTRVECTAIALRRRPPR